MPSSPTPAPSCQQRHRRRDWRGERTPVLVRLPSPVAQQLGEAAHADSRSLSETAAALIAAGLAAPGRA